MSAFEGFLQGFARTGSQIIQRQDVEDARLREIIVASDRRFQESYALNEQESKNRIKEQEVEVELLNRARQEAKVGLTASPLQADAQVVEDTDAEVDAVIATSAPTSPSVQEVSTGRYEAQVKPIDVYVDMAPGRTAQEIRANAERMRNNDLYRARALDARGAPKTSQDPFQKAKSAQEEEELGRAFTARSNFDTYMTDLNKTEAAARNTISRFGVNLTSGASVLKEAGTRGALQFVSQTKGAISNAEMELFKQASVSEDNPRAYNLTVINASKAVLIREKQKADFVDAWTKQYGKAEGALAAFRKFTEENKILEQGKKPGTLVLNKSAEELAKDTTWMRYLDPQYTKPKNKEEETKVGETPELSPAAKALAEKYKSLQGN